MRVCVIFNPAAKGEKAKRLRRHLDTIGPECALKQTVAAGGARPLAAEAVREGFDTIVAAGGDGTLNEVLNGIGDEPGSFERVRLGLLPLGTVNVFAKEMGIPTDLPKAWKIIRAEKETRIDLPMVTFSRDDGRQRRYFAQLAGAGLDARAIERVDWELKKKLGPLAYVWAGMAALQVPASRITATNGNHSATGELVLVGNGRFYGGRYRLFPRAEMSDGLLDVCVFPQANWMTLAQCTPMLMARHDLPKGVAQHFQAASVTLSSETQTPMEVDGESIGRLPATFELDRQHLRVIVP